MAGLRNFSLEDEEELRCQAMAVGDMLRQMKDATRNPQRIFGHTRGRGSQKKGRLQSFRGQRGGYQPQPWYRSSPMHRPVPPPPPQKFSPRHNPVPWQNFYDNEQNDYHANRLDDELFDYSLDRRQRDREVSPSRSDYDHHHKESGHHRDESISPQHLVKSLSSFPDFSATLLQLMEKIHLQPSAVRHVASAYGQVFCLDGEKVVLKPEATVCSDYLADEGCQNRSACQNFHLCPKFIAGKCGDKDCFLGHSWHTNHNNSLLESIFLDEIPIPELHKLFGMAGKVNCAKEPLTICSSYNTDGCKKDDCKELHVCHNFVAGYTKCKVADCELNHNILDESCSALLESHGFSTNEAPRDITIALVAASPSLAKTLKSNDEDESSSQTSNEDDVAESGPQKKSKKKKKLEKKSNPEIQELSNEENEMEGDSSNESDEEASLSSSKSDSEDSSTPSESGSDSSETVLKEKAIAKENIGKKERKNKNMKVEGNKQGKENPSKVWPRRTLWAHYPHGDVPVPEICYYSVESVCKNEGTGCQRLHAIQHFHWQVSDQGNRWLNLTSAQVVTLESAFCDVAEDGVDLPRLDPSKVEFSVSGLLILMGRDTWHADFKTMNLTNSANTKSLWIRRLCTENIDGQVMKPASFVWWFLDGNQKWVKYGNVDTLGKTDLVSNITSDDIEKHYLQNSSTPLPFKNSRFSYELDFKTMEQINQHTKVRREVRRRPEPHMTNEREAGRVEGDSEFPMAWDVMQPEERMQLVSLDPSSSEYQGVINLLAGKLTSNIVLKIERVQNPFLWRALQNKIKEMTTVYGDLTKVDVRQVFHGTCHSVVSSICTENFDWRLHGSSSGQMYGRGTYFSTDAMYSYKYCRADPNGIKYMFVAKVAIGAITAGNSNMPRPPKNPVTNAPYDSTVDNVSNFSIVVKYDKQEYYPEYILTLT